MRLQSPVFSNWLELVTAKIFVHILNSPEEVHDDIIALLMKMDFGVQYGLLP